MQKKGKIKNFFILLAALFFSICIVYTSAASEDKKSAEVKGRKIVAKVNGEPIYEDQLAPQVEEVLRKFKKHGMRKDSLDTVKRLQKRVLGEVIAQELLYQASKSLTIPDIEEKITDKIKVMKSRYPTEERFEASLKASNLSVGDVRESIKKNVYIDEYLKKKDIRNPEVPEADIKEYYEKYKDNFKRKESVRVSHILIKVANDAKPEEKELSRKKIEKIRQEILEGKDFAEMAKEHSDCERSSSQGGDLGYLERGYMPEEFDKVAFALKKGELSDIVQTEFGYHIIKIVDKKPEGIVPYDEVKDFINKYLQEGIAKKKLASHIEGLKEKAKIEIFLN
jgi:peptidyl-prolyl cis-trans isomerase C